MPRPDHEVRADFAKALDAQATTPPQPDTDPTYLADLADALTGTTPAKENTK